MFVEWISTQIMREINDDKEIHEHRPHRNNEPSPDILMYQECWKYCLLRSTSEGLKIHLVTKVCFFPPFHWISWSWSQACFSNRNQLPLLRSRNLHPTHEKKNPKNTKETNHLINLSVSVCLLSPHIRTQMKSSESQQCSSWVTKIMNEVNFSLSFSFYNFQGLYNENYYHCN